ncbi:undecaprenyl-diphosphatase [Alicyclobacillus ferrooxydans]|uniref:Phosphoesterase n=1 Tax=Alicyclobacillus ferrooxydans TaxID=471514 RepID=A0A0N8PN90_9BACL|nr:undecaprenyl-diphosphatase [Alicyclobacillus ferrooxydans]KPV40861.1 phosphoesterase [Alicyclobacillus ferrooxydans]
MFRSAFPNPFDTTLYHLINGLAGHNVLLDDVMIFFAKDALEIYAVLFIVSWLVLPKQALESRHALVMAGCAGILALVINMIISHIWFRPRPFTVFPQGTFTELVPHSADASFPSDHTSGSFGFAAGSWGKQQKWISHAFTVIAVVVMFARVFVGVHYPTDVLAGLVVGVFSGRIIWRFSRWIHPLSMLIVRMFRLGPKELFEEKHTK